jgi:hypothetical protein
MPPRDSHVVVVHHSGSRMNAPARQPPLRKASPPFRNGGATRSMARTNGGPPSSGTPARPHMVANVPYRIEPA